MSTRISAIVLASLAGAAVAQDFNGNFTQDAREIRLGTAVDCNHNTVPDPVDIDRPHFSTSGQHLNGLEGFQSYVWDSIPLDFDQDGRMDLAVVSSHNDGAFTSYIALWHNEGSIGLTFHSRFGAPQSVFTAIRAGDLNGDGRTDLIVNDADSPRIRAFLATGSGTFAAPVTLQGPASNNGFGTPGVADIDGDGDLDIAAPGFTLNAIIVWKNNGNGSFSGYDLYPAGNTPHAIEIGDFTGDGLPDMACANRYLFATGSGTVTLLRNTGGGLFTPHWTLTLPLNQGPFGVMRPKPMDIELIDTDHDGDRDIIVSSDESQRLDLYRNDGVGNFTLAGAIGSGYYLESTAGRFVVTDLDADGWEDIAWCDGDTAGVSIYKNNAGSFTFFQTYAAAHLGAAGISAADFTGDGLPELAVANHAMISFSILRNENLLNFDAPLRYRTAYAMNQVVLADFDNDGIDDLGSRDYDGTNPSVYAVHRGLGDGRFSPTPIVTSPISQNGIIFARDVNNDGNMDLLIVQGQCRVHLGRGDGTFHPEITNTVNVFLLAKTGDINADGNLDIAWIYPGHPESQMLYTLGDGAGHFGPAILAGMVPSEPESIGVVDITGDGAAELFSGHRLGALPYAALTRLINDGSGTFINRIDVLSPAPPPFNSTAPADIDGADFDSDGDTDIVFAGYGMHLMRNFGNGDLDLPLRVNSVAGSIIRVADIDQDGSPDLYTVGGTQGFNPSAPAAMLNDGTGDFTRTMLMHGYDSTAHSLAIGDINDDGRIDILTQPENSLGVYAYLNLPAFSRDTNHNGIPDECENLCPADLSGSSDPNDPAYGVPDGAADASDFFYYLDQFVSGNLAIADLSGSSDPNDPAYGTPDGLIDASDFFYYLDIFALGCP